MAFGISTGLGFGTRTSSAPVPDITGEVFEFTAALPSAFTYTRTGDATVRNNSGQWVSVAANTPRFDHSPTGTPLGIRFEPPRTNKTTQRNFAPTDTTGIAVISGDGSATLVADSTNLAAATITGATFPALQNGNAIQLTGGSGGTTYQISDQAGNTNAHSWRVCIATNDTAYSGTLAMSDGAGTQNIQNPSANAYREYTRNDAAPNNAIRYLRITVTAGKTMRIIGTQFEEGVFVSSPIITSGANATRSRETCVALGLDAADWFNTVQGAIVCEAMFDQVTGFDTQYAFLANEGTGLTNSMGFYINAGTASQARARDIIASTNNQNDDVHKPIANKRFPMAVSWQDGESLAAAGPMRFERRARAGSPTGMDRIYLGGRPFGNAMSGWIKSLRVYGQPRSITQLGAVMFPASGTYKAIMSGGQSNKHGYFRSQTDQLNSGEINTVAQMDTYWTTSENWLINGAENGSYAIKANDPNAGNSAANWWYDPAPDTFGPRMQDWEDMANAFGVSRIQAFDWDQGESDSATSVADLKTAWMAIFNRMRIVAGAKPVFITGIGRRSDSENTGYNNVRQAQRELASENAWIHLAPEKFTQALTDSVHLTDAGYGAHATQHTRRMLSVLGESVSGGTVPPAISGASRSGTSITVNLTHGAGGDFTPTSNIQGFKFFDGGSEIAITAAVRTNATTITLTLASAPSGAGTLYYGYGTLIDASAAYADLVKDNSTHTLPLRSAVVSGV